MARKNTPKTLPLPVLAADTLLQRAEIAQHNAAVEAAVAAPAPVALPAPVQAAAVALRGGLAVVAVAPGKPYRVQAGHNLTWLQQVQAAWAAGQGTAPVQGLLAAGVPAPFIGYMVRRGYAIPCTLPV
jgi:hypothetical protein